MSHRISITLSNNAYKILNNMKQLYNKDNYYGKISMSRIISSNAMKSLKNIKHLSKNDIDKILQAQAKLNKNISYLRYSLIKEQANINQIAYDFNLMTYDQRKKVYKKGNLNGKQVMSLKLNNKVATPLNDIRKECDQIWRILNLHRPEN